MGLPLEPPIDEEPQIPEILHRSYHVMCGVLPIWKDQACGSRKQIVFVWLLEEQQLCLIWLNRQTRPSQPFITDCVPRSEELGDICSLLCASKKDAIIHVHAQRGVIPTPHFVQQGRRVSDREYRGHGGALRHAHWLVPFLRGDVVKAKTYFSVSEKCLSPVD